MSEQAQNPKNYSLDPTAQINLLRRVLFGWDEQWFLKAVARYGFESAAEMDRQVRRDFGKLEMQALLKQLGKSRADDFADAVAIVALYARTLYGTANNLRMSTLKLPTDTQPGLVEVLIQSCMSAEVARKKRTESEHPAERGAIPACEACALNWDAWFETLLPGWQVDIERRPAPQNAHTRFSIVCYRPGTDVSNYTFTENAAAFPLPPIATESASAFDYPPIIGAEAAPSTALTFSPTPNRRVVFHESPPPPEPPTLPATVDGEAHEIYMDENETRRREAHLRSRLGITARDDVSTPLVEQLPHEGNRRPAAFISRMFFNKEARDLLEKSESNPFVVPMSIANGIERILQDLLAEDRSITDEAHVREGSTGDLEFVVGKQVFTSIQAVPIGPIQAKFQEAVRLWQAMVK